LIGSIADAPKDVENIINELRFCGELLNEIHENEKNFGPHQATRKALERCEGPLQDLHRFASSIIPGSAASDNIKRTWAAITAVRGKDRIVKFQAKLRDAKIDLVLARNIAAE